MSEVTKTRTTAVSEYQRVFDLQKANQQAVADGTANDRIRKIRRLMETVLKYRVEIQEALHKDFRKHPSEVDLTEIYPVTHEAKFAISHLRSWMKDEHVGTPLSLLGTSSWIHYEPKGVVLIMTPWNFPVNITFIPLISAIAAGNCAIIKPSENTPHTSDLILKMISEIFEENEVAVFTGGVEEAKSLLELPFNHIFFTGSPAVGKIVMAAASRHLASVTLELGGKTPTIVDETADVKIAAGRIAGGKFINNGQICIAPDYIYVHRSIIDEFKKCLKEKLLEMFGPDPSKSESYCRIVNARQFDRLSTYLDEGVSSELEIITGGQTDKLQDFIAPTLVSNADDNMQLMQDEIFGPILPIREYEHIDEALNAINKREKPLALYIYSKSGTNIKHIVRHTRAGGTVINHSALHYFNSYLPFGGVNNSGIGKAHGIYGFKEFSNPRGMLKQWSPISALDKLVPPYNKQKQKLIDFTIKWF